MLILPPTLNNNWTLIHKIIFRFFFVFIFIFIAPWSWLDDVPYYGELTVWYDNLMDWAVRFANEKIFHVKEVLVPVSGSGDTSWGWTQLWMITSLAFVVCFTWTLIDRKRKSYNKLNYWLCLFTGIILP